MKRTLATIVLAAALGGVGGYVIRDNQATATVRVGQAHSTPYQIGINTKDWSYDVPLTVPWRDRTGTWHSGSRPECLPPTGEISNIRFASVDVTGGALSSRVVVWVDCH